MKKGQAGVVIIVLILFAVIIAGFLFGPKIINLLRFTLVAGPMGNLIASDGNVYPISVVEVSGDTSGLITFADGSGTGSGNRLSIISRGASKVSVTADKVDLKSINTQVWDGKVYGWMNSAGCPYKFSVSFTDNFKTVNVLKLERTSPQFKKEFWQGVIISKSGDGYDIWTGSVFNHVSLSTLTSQLDANLNWQPVFTSESTCDSNTKSGLIFTDVRNLNSAPGNGALEEFNYAPGTVWYEGGEIEIDGPLLTLGDKALLRSDYNGRSYTIQTGRDTIPVPQIPSGKMSLYIFHEDPPENPTGSFDLRFGKGHWLRDLGKERFFFTDNRPITSAEGWHKSIIEIDPNKGASLTRDGTLIDEQPCQITAEQDNRCIPIKDIEIESQRQGRFDEIGVYTLSATPSEPTKSSSNNKLDLSATPSPQPTTTTTTTGPPTGTTQTTQPTTSVPTPGQKTTEAPTASIKKGFTLTQIILLSIAVIILVGLIGWLAFRGGGF